MNGTLQNIVAQVILAMIYLAALANFAMWLWRGVLKVWRGEQ